MQGGGGENAKTEKIAGTLFASKKYATLIMRFIMTKYETERGELYKGTLARSRQRKIILLVKYAEKKIY